MLFLKNFLVGNIGLAQKISMGNKTQLFIITIIILPLHNQFFIHSPQQSILMGQIKFIKVGPPSNVC